MDKKEAEFLEKLLQTFKIEADEHLKNLTTGLLNLENQPPEYKDQEFLEFIFREAHSLKGAARAVSFISIEKICQALENVLDARKKNKISFSKSSFDVMYAALDLITSLIQQDKRQTQDLPLLNELTEKLYQMIKTEGKSIQTEGTKSSKTPPTTIPSDETKQKHSPDATPAEVSSPIPGSTELHSDVLSEKKEPITSSTKMSEPISPHANPQHLESAIETQKTIRVSLTKLDHLMQQVEEMLIVKLTTNQRLQDLKNIQDSVSQWNEEWIKIQSDLHSVQTIFNDFTSTDLNQIRLSLKEILDFLKNQQSFMKLFRDHLNKYLKAAAQDTRMVAGLVDGLLDDTKQVLMQPISTLLEVFPRMVRDLSKQLEKDIHLSIQGGEIEIDKRILEELKDPLIHLIRNSIDHGIEKPRERQEWKKSIQGNITISASQLSGNRVEILISDDGRGVDIQQVKLHAIKQGVITEKEAARFTQRDFISLIFQSGVSTSPIITELSGRGLGLGIVAEKVEKLGGQIFVETKEHEGTTFKIILPLTLATFRGIHVQVAGYDFIIPTQNIKRVIRMTANEIKTLENRETITLENKTLSFISLATLLGLPITSPIQKPDNLFFVLILKAAETVIALGVDQVLNEQEVLVKGLGKQLVSLQNIAAATVSESGKIIPILDPFDLIKSIVKTPDRFKEAPLTSQQELTGSKKFIVLIAEDSVTARILLKNILESAGYDVKTAVDGAEAFSILKTEPIDLLLSDVEMPRMDGFTLTEKIRHSDKLKDLPIILCTSRGSQEDREHGIEVGANAYIDKSSFTHSNLLDIIQKLL